MVVPLQISSNDLAHLLPLHPWNAVQLPPRQLQVKSAGTTDGRSRLQQLHVSCQPPSAKKKVPSCREAKKFSAGLGFTSRSRAQTPPTPPLHFRWLESRKWRLRRRCTASLKTNKRTSCASFTSKSLMICCLSSSTFARGYTRSRLTSPVECFVQSFSFLLPLIPVNTSNHSLEYSALCFGKPLYQQSSQFIILYRCWCLWRGSQGALRFTFTTATSE